METQGKVSQISFYNVVRWPRGQNRSHTRKLTQMLRNSKISYSSWSTGKHEITISVFNPADRRA